MHTKNITARRLVTLLLCAILFFIFWNGYKQEGPSRSKFRKLPGGTEDLTQEALPVKEARNPIQEIASNRRVQEWVSFWQRCVPDFTLASMLDVGEEQITGESVDASIIEEEQKGPGKMFYTTAPGGKRQINPYWNRLLFRKEGDAWQPYVELRCGALLYEKSAKRARTILDCSMNEGIDDAVWLSKDEVALLGYESVTRQMSVECETVESCAAPAIWFLDLAHGSSHSYRGTLIKHGGCRLGEYLRQRLPKFYTP
jgi:hypothetical protein